jgi:flagellin
MALGVLNNISAINAQNNLANTQASLSKTLQQLSSGSRINSGADDAAGLSLANGLQASSTALSQSAKNASEGVDFLQVADGALAQVTSLLNRAVTLATEASNGTLNSSQTSAADSEYQKILTEINTINNNTEYNGINTFASTSSTSFTMDNASTDKVDGNTALSINGHAITPTATESLSVYAGEINSQLGTAGVSNIAATVSGNKLVIASTDGSAVNVTGSFLEDKGLTPSSTSTSTTYMMSNSSDNLIASGLKVNGTAITPTTAAGESAAILAGDINTQLGAASVTNVIASVVNNKLVIASNDGSAVNVSGTVREAERHSSSNASGVSIFTSDGSISQTYNSGAMDVITADTGAMSLTGSSLTSISNAKAALSGVTGAITSVAADRGIVGANINTLTAVQNVMTTQSTNTLAAENDVTATDYGQATSDMSKFQILSQTGIAALSQANQAQQLITKLLQ